MTETQNVIKNQVIVVGDIQMHGSKSLYTADSLDVYNFSHGPHAASLAAPPAKFLDLIYSDFRSCDTTDQKIVTMYVSSIDHVVSLN